MTSTGRQRVSSLSGMTGLPLSATCVRRTAPLSTCSSSEVSASARHSCPDHDQRTSADFRLPLRVPEAPINDVTYSALSGVIYVHDVEDRVKAIFLKPSALGTEGRIAVHQGSVWVRSGD